MYPIKKTDWWEIIARRMELKEEEEDDHTEHIGWPHRWQLIQTFQMFLSLPPLPFCEQKLNGRFLYAFFLYYLGHTSVHYIIGEYHFSFFLNF